MDNFTEYRQSSKKYNSQNVLDVINVKENAAV